MAMAAEVFRTLPAVAVEIGGRAGHHPAQPLRKSDRDHVLRHARSVAHARVEACRDGVDRTIVDDEVEMDLRMLLDELGRHEIVQVDKHLLEREISGDTAYRGSKTRALGNNVRERDPELSDR